MKKRNKFSIVLMTSLLCILITISPVQATISQFNNLQDLQDSLNSIVLSMPMSESYPIYWGPNYEGSLTEGYNTTVNENGILYKLRVRNVRLEQAGYGPLEIKGDPICTLSPGQTYTTSTTKSVATQRKISIDGGISFPLGETIIKTIDLHVGYSQTKTVTHTVQEGWTYTFPSSYIGKYNSISWYAGFHHDKYLATIDKVPYNRTEELLLVTDYRIIEDGGEYHASILEYTLENGTIRQTQIYPDERLEDIFQEINGSYYDLYVTYKCDYNSRQTYYATLLKPIPGEYIVGRN
ncbi:hypothetical protein [Abyssisolibacter fermentans]|uniref:hypothetical protein n=1 Tax=Abyssisolibacter fermentans TaxID=1766203 RepID=UPI0008364311|nr:hypothetical protein [Abyssisolibacter fermentans]